MALDACLENYLSEIIRLQETGGVVATGRLAAVLGVSGASATEMVLKLEKKGLVQYLPYKGVRLTAKGRKDADGVLRRHRLVECFLSKTLGLEDVHADAHALEHALSSRVVSALEKFLKHPKKSPSGKIIPC